MNRPQPAKPSESVQWRQLRTWYGAMPGSILQQALQAQIDALLPQLFGYHALQVGNPVPECDWLQASRINHRVVMDLDPALADLGARPDALPVLTDSLDLILLAHSLEFSHRPHEILREVDRTLVPEGHVIVLGFNPYSLYGLWRLSLGWRGEAPWSGRFLAAGRVKDWLSLLGFEVLRCTHLGFRPPISRASVAQRLAVIDRLGARWWPFAGGAYVLLARKRVATLTPIRPRWRPRRALAPNLTEPSS